MSSASLKRRQFLQAMAAAGLSASLPWSLRSHAAGEAQPYTGPFFVSIEAEGGWDVTSFCDPKATPAINRWAQTSGVQSINGSPIQYAPFAHNQRFFNKHYADTLVINGIDTQTNAHQAGRRHSWSGRLAEGYPSFAAMAAGALGPQLPLAYLSNGGYNQTGGLVTYTLMQDPSALNKLVYQEQFLDYDPNDWDAPKFFHRKATRDILNRYKAERLARLQNQPHMAPRIEQALNQFATAHAGQSQLQALADYIPATLVSNTDDDGYWNPLRRQAQIALAAYRSGLCVSADLVTWGFDTHADHDNEQTQAMQRLQNGIEYLWSEAERLGIADRLIVLVQSDFGRTPEYNDGNGKDHWPITSALIMARNVSWANRVVGQTTAAHEAQAIDPTSLQLSSSGVVLQPKHIQQAMRRLAGIENHAVSQQFPLDAENINFFS
ncbi:Tat pathway signal protein [Bacterioplanes sanyensis]|uniref:Tat pathway signal protein n=1 Tax=Bacterioplanes sanyensis TaxID=1249553 RepID=A0A222FQ47_9GAMM|nr:DUF1501 domain-containing protein [Bacterioplanes sanyensis]ASP40646.1 Tat pathway signal protein [Bacterioplanes sanyensis]